MTTFRKKETRGLGTLIEVAPNSQEPSLWTSFPEPPSLFEELQFSSYIFATF